MTEVVVGIDFAGPASARDQRRKILAVVAERTGDLRYAVSVAGLNDRLRRAPPGWTAPELVDALLSMRPPPSVVAADFPFSVPRELLARRSFAAAVGVERPFETWWAFNAAVARRIGLECPIDYSAFRGWRRRRLWKAKRACDRASGAQPPLKDRFQATFNMTLLGNAFLARLRRSGRHDVVPFDRRGRAPIIEVYPGHAMRALGVRDYKHAPARAIDAALRHLASRGIELSIDPEARAACEAHDTGGTATHDHDGADAIVAACLAALHREGLAREIVGTQPGAGAPEGTIWSVASSGMPGPAGPAPARSRAERKTAMPRAKALIVDVEDRPGMLGEIASALGERNVNLRAVHGSNEGGRGVVRLVVDKLALAKRVLAAHGWAPREEEIVEIGLPDRPGALGEVAKRLGDARVNIQHVFVSTSGARKATAFLAVSDVTAALRALR